MADRLRHRNQWKQNGGPGSVAIQDGGFKMADPEVTSSKMADSKWPIQDGRPKMVGNQGLQIGEITITEVIYILKIDKTNMP